MVSALANTRLIASQMALQILTASADDSSSQDDSSSTPGSGDISSLPSSSQASLTSSLNGMAASQADTTSASSSSTVASTDITTSSFMALLKQNLTATAKKNDDGGQAQAMLDALNNGTLTVNDPINGVSITAWDPSAAANTDTTDQATSTSGTSSTGNTGTTIPTTDWNDYLKTHLERGSNGTFTRASDGSFIDKTTGKEAYFGQVGSQFYYLTWSAPGKDGAGTAAGGTATTSSTDT
jgi:hypothetical protein